jgi:hypothetical protein
VSIAPIAVSTLAIVLIAAGVVVALLLVGGLLAVRRRNRQLAGRFEADVAAADQALEQARAADRGWDRNAMEEAVRGALAEAKPDFAYEQLHLVLVDDRPGTEEDRAHFAAVGSRGETRVVMARDGDRWVAETVE